MNFKPNNFYTGLVEFFAILLPGFIVSVLLYVAFEQEIELFIHIESGTGMLTLSFFLSACLFGNILFPLGSFLDKIYDSTKHYFFRDNRRLQLTKKIRAPLARTCGS